MINTESQDPNCSLDLAKEIVNGYWKETVTITGLSKEDKQELINLGIAFEPTMKIAWQTLNKWAKESTERGLKIGEEITIFTYQEAKIK